MNHGIKYILGVTAIFLGIVTIVWLVKQADIVAGILSLTFGIMAIIWSYKARKALSPGSSLREYSMYFIICLIFLVTFSVVLTAERFFVRTGAGTILVYVEYLLLTLAYLTFVTAAFKIWNIGQEFGFEKESAEIRKAMKKKKK
ncbi:MAG: hypothetical protein FJ045_04085 [Crenarchaeota archaeon]|nr:hypothetical protein [Thermoproteota archaeon]